jgi:hypothetical protein
MACAAWLPADAAAASLAAAGRGGEGCRALQPTSAMCAPKHTRTHTHAHLVRCAGPRLAGGLLLRHAGTPAHQPGPRHRRCAVCVCVCVGVCVCVCVCACALAAAASSAAALEARCRRTAGKPGARHTCAPPPPPPHTCCHKRSRCLRDTQAATGAMWSSRAAACCTASTARPCLRCRCQT